MRQVFLLSFGAVFSLTSAAQVQSPEGFLGYRLGKQFTPHYRVVEYFRHVAMQASNQVKIVEYGTTYEGRPLLAAIVTSPTNMVQLEEIRRNNLRLTGLEEGQGNLNGPVIVWLTYNVHGNEAVSTEAAMLTLYELLSKYTAWLKEAVVIIDPCANPDGHSRYVNWYMQMVGVQPNIDPDAREHHEPWPGGRFNHYHFDLNRDWAWQSQRETQQRIAFYQQWMPQVHGDFHEMGVEQPYYFAPAAEPYHKEITSWQREFQSILGKNIAQYFDRNHRLYFTRETFDLLYPSYGDTWPTFNGAIGMTYEQGGSGRAGLSILTNNGDTLTLSKRIENQHTAGMATIEIAVQQRKRLLEEFRNYFAQALTYPTGAYKSFIISAGNDPHKLKTLTEYLDRNQIRYGLAANAMTVKAFNYRNGKEETVNVTRNDLVITIAQPKSVLVKVLFNPRTVLADSVTYDATAWALPYAMDLEAYAAAERIASTAYKAPEFVKNQPPQGGAYAYLAPWRHFNHARLLAAWLKNGLNVRFAEQAFTLNGTAYQAGTLVVSKADNTHVNNFDQLVNNIANNLQVNIQPTQTGLVASGIDLGSTAFRLVRPFKVALIAGEGISPTAFGEAWHFFDHWLAYPVTVVHHSMIERMDWNKYDVIIMPSGNYRNLDMNTVKSWLRRGGKLIAIEDAINAFADKEGFFIKTKKEEKEKDAKPPKPEELIKKYGDRRRDELTNSVEGAIFRVAMDTTHPLAFGYTPTYFTLKHTNNFYEFLEEGWNVGVLKPNSHVDGFVGSKAKEKLNNTLVFGVENFGRGTLIYLVDSPIYRHSWQGGHLLMSNAIFLVGR